MCCWLPSCAGAAQESLRRRRQFLAARNYFRRELRKPSPRLDDAWIPYLLAFGLGPDVDRWFKVNGSAATGSTSSGFWAARPLTPLCRARRGGPAAVAARSAAPVRQARGSAPSGRSRRVWRRHRPAEARRAVAVEAVAVVVAAVAAPAAVAGVAPRLRLRLRRVLNGGDRLVALADQALQHIHQQVSGLEPGNGILPRPLVIVLEFHLESRPAPRPFPATQCGLAVVDLVVLEQIGAIAVARDGGGPVRGPIIP